MCGVGLLKTESTDALNTDDELNCTDVTVTEDKPTLQTLTPPLNTVSVINWISVFVGVGVQYVHWRANS